MSCLMADTVCMVPIATLLATASTFWAAAAPGTAEQNCPNGVQYNVKTLSAMGNHANPNAVAEAHLGSCVITFRSGWRKFRTDRGACRTVLHEYGHAALKLDHDAGGIMAPGGTIGATTPAACMRYSNR